MPSTAVRSRTMPSRGADHCTVTGATLRFLHGGDDRLRNVQVRQALTRATSVHLHVADDCRVDRGQVFRRGGCDRRTVDFHQRLARPHAGSGGHVSDFLHEAFGPHRDHGYSPFIELDGAGRLHRHADRAPRDWFRLHAGALDLAGRKLDRTVVRLVVLVDRDVVHPHRVLLRRRRGIRQPHRIAVVEDLARSLGPLRLRLRRLGRGVLLVHRQVVPPLAVLFWTCGPGGSAARIAIIEDGSIGRDGSASQGIKGPGRSFDGQVAAQA